MMCINRTCYHLKKRAFGPWRCLHWFAYEAASKFGFLCIYQPLFRLLWFQNETKHFKIFIKSSFFLLPRSTVNASNSGPFLARSVASLGELRTKNEQKWVCRLKVFVQLSFWSFFYTKRFDYSKSSWKKVQNLREAMKVTGFGRTL
jgi:hypothetical protein